MRMITGIAISVSSVLAVAGAAQTDPVQMLYNFKADGLIAGVTNEKITYLISAVGHAPVVKENGIVRTRSKNDTDDDDYKVILSGATISFDAFDLTDPTKIPSIATFSCEGCTLTFPDGSTLTSDTAVPLEGRALFLYGPVAFNPATPTKQTIRMAGCSGLKATSTVGKLGGKVGTICFNGEFYFDMNNPYVITGSSDCTIVTHTPLIQSAP